MRKHTLDHVTGFFFFFHQRPDTINEFDLLEFTLHIEVDTKQGWDLCMHITSVSTAVSEKENSLRVSFWIMFIFISTCAPRPVSAEIIYKKNQFVIDRLDELYSC